MSGRVRSGVHAISASEPGVALYVRPMSQKPYYLDNIQLDLVVPMAGRILFGMAITKNSR